ncbi:MAG TPA: [LysW]-lysine hydrolase [Roseiflexaceae bacterium]|nr:[LysW]-lysine hydrolase [Roseiflexaceae bacterium]
MSDQPLDPIALLERMLRIPSPSTQEAELAQFLAAEMGRLGFASFVDEAGNAVGVAGEGPEIVLLGHIDTVPGVVPVRIEGGRLYGRGAVDAKGPFAAFVAAAARLLTHGGLRARLVLVGAVEEEAASSRGAHFVKERYRPVACVIGEPSGWDRLTLGYKGRLLVDGRWEQAAAHSAGREPAVAERAVTFWNAVAARCAAYNAGRERLFDQLLPSLRAIRSGGDGLLDWAELTVGVRLPPAVDPQELARALEADAGGGALRFHDLCPAYQGNKNTPLVRAFLRGVRAAGGTPGFLLKTGTSDMNVVGPAWGCPILAYGPGDSSLDHTPHEHVEIAEYLRAIDVLEQALVQLCA